MARKKIDLRKVKKNKRYTVKSLAETLGITPRAIYWDIHKDDLPCFETNGTKKIWGKDFIKFTKERRKKHKRLNKKEGDFFCLNCSNFFRPLNNEITIETSQLDALKIKMGIIVLRGICPCCLKHFFQLSNLSKIEELQALYNIKPTIPNYTENNIEQEGEDNV